MPVGAPSYRPDPKSGWAVLAAPIVATQAAELAETGSWSTGVFQILSAGRTGQLPMAGDWAVALQTLSRVNPGRTRSMARAATLTWPPSPRLGELEPKYQYVHTLAREDTSAHLTSCKV